MALSPDCPVGQWNLARQSLLRGPAVETVKARDGPVPRTRRDALLRIFAPARAMIGKDILPVRLPDNLAARFRKKTDPDENIVAICTEGMAGANTVEREVAKETIEMKIVERPVAQDHWDVSVETGLRSLLLNGDVRNRRDSIHSLFNLPPDPHPGACID